MDQPILTTEPACPEIPHWSDYPTLDAAYVAINNLSNALIRRGTQVIASHNYQDRFKQYRPRQRIAKLLGVTTKASKDAEKLAPGGKWWVRSTTTHQNVQFEAWYDRFLPYAYGMMMSENGYECFGLDFTSVNSFFNTCLGFVELGTGNYGKIVEEDVDLFLKIFNWSMDITPPQLPFDEAYRPCCCYVAARKPELFLRHVDNNPEDYRSKHVAAVFEKANIPWSPKWGKRRKVA